MAGVRSGLERQPYEVYPQRMSSLEELVARDIGRDGIKSLVSAFYQCVRNDDLIGPMYPDDDWDGSEFRLRSFLLFRLMGDPEYTIRRGHPRLRMRHMPFSIGEEEKDRWLELMADAIKETQITGDTAVALMEFFTQVADFMRNR